MGEVHKFYTAQWVGERVLMKRGEMSEPQLQAIVDGLRQKFMRAKVPSHGTAQACLPREQVDRYTAEFLSRVRELDTDPQTQLHSGKESFARAYARAKNLYPALFTLSRCMAVASDSPMCDVEVVG